MSSGGRVAKVEWPEYDSEERKKIAALIRRQDHLSTSVGRENAAEREYWALSWLMPWLKDENTEFDEDHYQTLLGTQKYLGSMKDMNGYQLQELSALNWAIEEIDETTIQEDE